MSDLVHAHVVKHLPRLATVHCPAELQLSQPSAQADWQQTPLPLSQNPELQSPALVQACPLSSARDCNAVAGARAHPIAQSSVPQTNDFLFCPQGQVVTGLFGHSGSYIDRIGVVCAEVLVDGTLGPSGSAVSAEGNGGGYFDDSDHSCPVGWGANGIYGNSGAYVDAIGLRCVPPSFANSASTQPSQRAGGNGGHGYNIECPTRQVGARELMTGVTTWSGNLINAVAVECGQPWWP